MASRSRRRRHPASEPGPVRQQSWMFNEVTTKYQAIIELLERTSMTPLSDAVFSCVCPLWLRFVRLIRRLGSYDKQYSSRRGAELRRCVWRPIFLPIRGSWRWPRSHSELSLHRYFVLLSWSHRLRISPGKPKLNWTALHKWNRLYYFFRTYAVHAAVLCGFISIFVGGMLRLSCGRPRKCTFWLWSMRFLGNLRSICFFLRLLYSCW